MRRAMLLPAIGLLLPPTLVAIALALRPPLASSGDGFAPVVTAADRPLVLRPRPSPVLSRPGNPPVEPPSRSPAAAAEAWEIRWSSALAATEADYAEAARLYSLGLIDRATHLARRADAAARARPLRAALLDELEGPKVMDR